MPDNPWTMAAAQGASNVVNTGLGLILGGINDSRQYAQQARLQGLQIQGQKEMAEYYRQQQLQMWRDTGPTGQMEQLKLAGLNPGLIYGMGGAGGQTANVNTGSVQGAVAPQGGHEVMDMLGMGLMNAQVQNIKAQTEKTQAETKKLETVDTTKTETEIQSLNQGISNAKAQERLTNLQSEIAQVQASVSRQTINEQMKAWEQIIAKGTEEIRQLQLNNDITEAQKADKIKMLQLEVAGQALQNGLTKLQQDNVSEQTKLIASEIANNKIVWQKLVQDIWMAREYLSNEKLKTLIMENNSWQNNTGDNDLDLIVPILGNIQDLLKKGGGHTPVQGFRR